MRNVSPVQLPIWSLFSLPAELSFCSVLISATRILPQFRPRVTKPCSFHLYEKFFSSANTPQTLKLCFFLNVRRTCCNYCKKRLLLFLSRSIRRAERNLKSHTVSCFDFLVHRPFQKPEISRIIKASRKKLWLNKKQTTLQILLLGSRLFFPSVVTNSNKHVFWRQCVVLS